jgi:hypothetical protein
MDIYIKKLGATVPVDWDALSPAIQAQVIDYGLKQKLSDGLSEMSVAKGNTVEEMNFAVGEAIAALVAGEWSARGRTADPVTARAKAIAKGLVARMTKAQVAIQVETMSKAEGRELDAYVVRDTLAKRLAASERIVAMAKAQVEAEGGETVDLDGLL